MNELYQITELDNIIYRQSNPIRVIWSFDIHRDNYVHIHDFTIFTSAGEARVMNEYALDCAFDKFTRMIERNYDNVQGYTLRYGRYDSSPAFWDSLGFRCMDNRECVMIIK